MTIHEINALYQETFYMEDNVVLPLLVAMVIGSKLKGPAVWMYLIGPSSNGKSELITMFSKIQFVTQVSDLTTNTFLSGFASNKKEASLLKQLGLNFVVVMKDFTTILSKSDESQEAIISQMREIYDGHMTKYTGTGQVLEWGPGGKGTFIMATTESIYAAQDKFSDMGTRAINYVMMPQDRIKTTKRAIKNAAILEKGKEKVQDAIAEFVIEKIQALPAYLPPLSDELEDQIIEVSDFSETCRSIVKRDYKGAKNLALSAGMPMRMAKQLLAIGQQLTYVYDGELSEDAKNAIFKTGFDSIPKQRRLVLETMTKFDKVNIAGLSDAMNYPDTRCREWVEDLQMFGVTRRIKAGNKEYWELKPEYKVLMKKYFNLKKEGESLESDRFEYGAGNYQEIDRSVDEKQNEADMDTTF